MKRILYTQRVEAVSGYNERRDCADQQIARFIWSCGFLPIAMNNLPELTAQYIEALQPAGIVLTGGNDLAVYGGSAPERDDTESKLLEIAIRDNIPLLGFCRGMQLLSWYFGAKLMPVTGHVATWHRLNGDFAERKVNSYHNFAVNALPDCFEVLAQTEDGTIEAIRHRTQRLLGIMWHPEREPAFSQADVNLFREFFV